MTDPAAFFDYPGTGAGEAEPELLPSWSDRQWDALLDHAEAIRFRLGEQVVTAGEVDQSVLIVIEGTLEAVVPTGLTRRRYHLEPGSLVGELAFFDGEPRSADVVATSDGELMSLSREAFERFAARHPGLARQLLMDLGKILAHRLRRAQGLGRR
ncbi:MAG: cyclic nucleotide-binding domain-containing protein [Egibacteraceae bacterium]